MRVNQMARREQILGDFVGDQSVRDQRARFVANFHADTRETLAIATHHCARDEIGLYRRASEVHRHRDGHAALRLGEAPNRGACREVRE